MRDHPKTGLVCQACQEPVAMVEAYEPTKVVMRCPACGHIWRTEKPKR
jgi:predicted RNA-binding Zn-ribbon protein involved in translation (DUF1610 family)